MTDRLKGLVVTFDKDYRTDDAKAIIDAIRMVKGVLSVESCVTNVDDLMNRSRIFQDVRKKLFEVVTLDLEA